MKGMRKGRDKGAHRIEVIDVNTHNIDEHLLAEDIGEQLFAETEDWNNREVEGKRRWGYKGMRVGEAHTRQLLRRLSARYKHVYTQIMIMHEHRCTRSQTIKVSMIKRNNNELTGTKSKRVRDERGRKRTRVMNSLAKRDSINAYPRDIGEHLLAENIGEHLFAKTENWNNREVEGREHGDTKE